jgi:hypothetical protein
MIRVVPSTRCTSEDDDFAAVVNPPYRGRNATYLQPSHSVTAQEAAKEQYVVWFVRTCTDKAEDARLNIVLWPYSYTESEADKARADLGTSPMGKLRLTILESKTSPLGQPVGGPDHGKIDWLSFRVDVWPRTPKGDPSNPFTTIHQLQSPL